MSDSEDTDKELGIMQVCYDMMHELSPESAHRVAAYLMMRFPYVPPELPKMRAKKESIESRQLGKMILDANAVAHKEL